MYLLQMYARRRLKERGSPLGVIHDGADKGPVDLNISDILDAICIADPAFDAREVGGMQRLAPAPPAPAPASLAPVNTPAPAPTMAPAAAPAPSVRIVEQPASKALRFRYECEGRSAGSIPGVNSTSERKTFPTIEISGCTGSAVVIVSCVTKDHPYKPHPHNLVGRERCDKGVCTMKTELAGDGTLVSFSNLGIQCVKRKDIELALRTREELRVDPFKTGFGHRSQPQSIDLNAVRLCFQVFVTGERNKVRLALPPVVSDVIFDKKAMCDLHIARISHCAGPIRGRMTMILLCERVAREDTAVVFFEKQNEQVVWEAAATNVHVHKQVAIAFDTPPYRNPDATKNVKVFLQLKRTTDNARSNALDFEYTVPPDFVVKRKKPLSPFAQNIGYQMEVGGQIKSERESPAHMRSPPRHAHEHEQLQSQWPFDMPPSINMAGPSQVNQYSHQGMTWMDQNYLQPNQHMQPGSPNMQPVSPGMQTMSPHLQPMSPNMQAMSPNMQAMSPHLQPMSPHMQSMSPHIQQLSPMGHAPLSPNMGQVSPGMSHAQYVQNVAQQNLIQQDMNVTTNSTPSISKLLEVQGPGEEMRLSSDLSFPMCGADLSDSLKELSTRDLLDNSDWPPHGGG